MATISSSLKELSVLAVDAYPLMRSGLREVLSTIAEKVHLIEGADVEEGFLRLQEHPNQDLIVLDLDFAIRDVLAPVRRFRASAPTVPLLVHTMREDAHLFRQALCEGASGVMPKTHSMALVRKAIELVMGGGIYVPPQLARLVSTQNGGCLRWQTGNTSVPAMSMQQWQIAELVAGGAPNKAIARALGIAASTVKNQLTTIFQYLGVSNRTEAAVALRSGFMGAGMHDPANMRKAKD